MDMQNTYTSDGVFADRCVQIPAWFLWAASNREVSGIPLEGIASVLNQTCADGWINIPGAGINVITDGTFTGAISGTTLSTSALSGAITVGR